MKMKKRVSKKGMELSLNTIIIAVIVIIVLVSVVAFFLFGFKSLTDKAKMVFFGVTAGSSKSLAMQYCETYCRRAELMPMSMRIQSSYCSAELLVDSDDDGEADLANIEPKAYVKWKCNLKNPPQGVQTLGVPCSVKVNDNGDLLENSCSKAKVEVATAGTTG